MLSAQIGAVQFGEGVFSHTLDLRRGLIIRIFSGFDVGLILQIAV